MNVCLVIIDLIGFGGGRTALGALLMAAVV